MHVVYCVDPPQQRPGETYREAVLSCVLYGHFGEAVQKDELRAECLDATRWEHVPSANASTLATIHRSRKQFHSERAIPNAEQPGSNSTGESE